MENLAVKEVPSVYEKHTVYVVATAPYTHAMVMAAVPQGMCAIESFVSAEEFLEHADIDKPSLLFTDIALPAMSGVELIDEARNRCMPLHTVLMVENLDGPDEYKAVSQIDTSIIEKPLRHFELKNSMTTLLSFLR